jgi:hypothetical protein
MAPAPYPDFSWFSRAVRIFPIVAGALLAGGAIGGVSVFAVDSALTAPPHQDLRAETSPPNAPSPIRTIDAPALNPSPAAATPAPVQAQTVPSAQPQTAALVQPTPQTQVQAMPEQVQAMPEVTAPQIVARTVPAKRRVLISRMKQRYGDTLSDSADNAAAAKSRRVYDYYGDTRADEDRNEQGGDTTSAGTPLANVHLPRSAHNAWNATPKTRVVIRHQVPAYPD